MNCRNRLYTHVEGPEEDGIKYYIIVTIENNVEVTDLEQYAQLNIRVLERELQDCQELKRAPKQSTYC
ncbi:MAG: hypothetical protein ACFFCW_18380 [Candidatus Hodarchaeota archaeon]